MKIAISITLDADVSEALERYAKAQRTSKSELINKTLAQCLLGDYGRPIREEEKHADSH